jgi:hypothetical protein
LTEKDCNLIDSYVFKDNNVEKYNIVEDTKMKRRNVEMQDNLNINSDADAGLLIGFYPSPNKRGGFEYVLDHCEESARKNKTLLAHAEQMIGKKMYFYIWKDVDTNSKKYYDNSYFSKVHGGEQGIFGKIFGEGIIDNVFLKNGRKYITYKSVIHYRDYVDFDKVKKLVERMNKNGWNKRRIRNGLFLTKEECNQISKLAGIV